LRVSGTEQRRLSVEGCEFGIETRGSGPGSFVLVPGIGMSPRYFEPLARELAAGATVHALHLPGFGQARRPPRPLPLGEYGRLAALALRNAGAGPGILVGHSMGCQVAVEIALADSAAIRGLVLIGPPTNSQERVAWRQGLRLLQDSVREPAPVTWTAVGDYRRCGARWYFAIVPFMISYRLEERLRLVRVPVVLVRGEHDPIAPRPWLAELAAANGMAAVAEVPGQAHAAMYGNPQAIARQCLDLAARA